MKSYILFLLLFSALPILTMNENSQQSGHTQQTTEQIIPEHASWTDAQPNNGYPWPREDSQSYSQASEISQNSLDRLFPENLNIIIVTSAILQEPSQSQADMIFAQETPEDDHKLHRTIAIRDNHQ